MMDEEKFRQKREELLAKEKILTMKKIKELFTKYFTPEKIEMYNNNSDKENGLTNLKEILSSLEKDLSETNDDIEKRNNHLKQF